MGPTPQAMTPEDLRAAVREVMVGDHVPGLSLAVCSSTALLHAEAFGSADLATRRPVTADTRFLWFSMSKIVTATAAMRLADEGRLDLDAPVSSVVPAFTAAGRGRLGPEPRIRQLIDHTAGAPNPPPLRWVRPATASAEQERRRVEHLLRRARPHRPAGGPARYSNLGYLVLAEVVARTAGEAFDDHVRRSVLGPAGMDATGYRHEHDAEHAVGYVRGPRPLGGLLRATLPAGVVGARYGEFVALRPFEVLGAGYGGLIGPVTDTARLLRMHLADGVIDGERILLPATARAMRTIVTPGRPFDLGLGWFRRPADRAARPAFVEHWGVGAGFFDVMRLYPDRDLGVVVMTNATRRFAHERLLSVIRSVFAP